VFDYKACGILIDTGHFCHMDALCRRYGMDSSCDISMQVLGSLKDEHDVFRMPWLIPLLQQGSGTSSKLMDCQAEFPRLFAGSCGGTGGLKMTVMWRNLPNNYSRDSLLSLIDGEGFAGSYDFFYAPYDFTNNALVGYAIINFVSNEEADRFFYHFQGFGTWSFKSGRVSEVTWSQPSQGLKGHIERYRNSPVMHRDVSDEKKPILLRDGIRIPFPMPTRRINAPQLKQ